MCFAVVISRHQINRLKIQTLKHRGGGTASTLSFVFHKVHFCSAFWIVYHFGNKTQTEDLEDLPSGDGGDEVL